VFRNISAVPLGLKCGYGPRLVIGGTTVYTKATGTMGDLLEGRPLEYEACRKVPLQPGTNRLSAPPFDGYRIETALVGERVQPDEAAPSSVRVLRWTAGERKVQVNAANRSFLTVNENYNIGWEARVGGKKLRPVRLDGWKQGWLVPAGTSGTAELTFGPDRAHRVSVVVGLNLLLLMLLVAIWPRGRGKKPRAPAPSETAAKGWPAWAAFGLAAALGFWVAGPPGLAVTAFTALICGWARTRRGRTRRSRLLQSTASPWAVALLMAAGTGCLTWGLWTGSVDNPASPSGALADVVPQLIGLVILGRLALQLWRPRRASPAGPEGSIELNWTGPDAGPPDRGPAAPAAPVSPPADPGEEEPDAEPASPEGSSSPSPLRWSLPAEEGDPSTYPPETHRPSSRTSPR
jgi:arabinofuranan 3-O-arabinosyltransferase